MKFGNNERGQGLVEYLIIVCLMAVATIAILRTMNQTVTKQFTKATLAIAGKSTQNVVVDAPNAEDYDKRDMSDFFNGSYSRDEKKK